MSTTSSKSKPTILGSTYMSISGKSHQRRKLITRKRLRKYSWLPDVFRIKNSIIYRIIGPVLTVTFLAFLVAYAASKGKSLTLTNSVTPLLAVVVGLILVFRNGTSYDRYYEGRKSFGALTSHIRNVSRLIWINVALPPTDDAPSSAKGKTPTTSVTPAQLRRAKTEALKLCLAFAYSVKHYLREEDGLDWDDYADVLPRAFARAHEARAYRAISDATQSSSPAQESSRGATPDPVPDLGKVNRGLALSVAVDVEAPSPSPAATKRVRVKRSVDKLHGTKTPLLSADHHTVNFDRFAETTIPLPLVIAHEINLKLFKFRRDGFLETVGPAGVNAMSQGIQGMVDQMTNLERIANTPIPKSYGIHLKQCVTLYLFCLPFTLLKELGWSMIPVVTVIAFTFMGIEGIAEEIEMPFGYDGADLPLDRYCFDLKEEIEYTIDRLPEGGFGGYGYDDGEGDD